MQEVDASRWNYSTVHASERARAAQMQADTRRAASCTRTRALKQYTPPVARVEQMTARMRAQKRAAREAENALEQRWGTECAQAMRHIEQLRTTRGTRVPRRLRVSKADKAAVEALPQSDSEPEAPLATVGSQLAAALSQSLAAA